MFLRQVMYMQIKVLNNLFILNLLYYYAKDKADLRHLFIGYLLRT